MGRDVRNRLLVLLAFGVIAAIAIPIWRMLPNNSPQGSLLISGNIEAHESLVSFKDIQSRIIELPFDEGQWVEKGTLLARADDANYRQQVAIDEAQVRAAQQQLASAQQNFTASRKTILDDEADLALKRADLARFRELWKEDATSKQTLDHSTTEAAQSAAALERDRALAKVAEKNVGVAEANIRSAIETLNLAKLMLEYTTLRAPFTGVILVRNGELGEAVQPGTPVVTLADLDHVWLRGYVAETDLARVRWGQTATITADTYPGKRYRGRISSISSQAEFTPKSVETHEERVTLVYRLKIDVENPGHELKPGMPADATIDLTSGSDGTIGNGPVLHRD